MLIETIKTSKQPGILDEENKWKKRPISWMKKNASSVFSAYLNWQEQGQARVNKIPKRPKNTVIMHGPLPQTHDVKMALTRVQAPHKQCTDLFREYLNL